MPEPQPGAGRPADGSTPTPGGDADPAVTAGPTDPPVPSSAEPPTSPDDTPARGSAAVPPPATPAEPTPARPDPTRLDVPPDPTRQEPAAPRWSGSAAVPPPPPRRPAWGESAEPTPVPPPAPHELPEHRTPVDPWAGADTGGWELNHPELPPTLPYPTPPQTRPYQSGPAPAAPPALPYQPSAPPYQPTPPPVAHPAPPAPTPTRPYPVAPAPAARPVSPPPPPARPALPPAPPRPPKQRRSRPEPVTPPPDWKPPKGYVRRKRRRWPWVLLLSLACCCGCPAWFGTPIWQQYPADAALPGQVADLTLREDSGGEVQRLEAEVRKANLLAEDVFAGVYGTDDGKRVTVFGDTGFRFSPESDADDAMTRLTDTFALGAPQPVDTGVRGRYERCATGSSEGTDVVVCTSVDHGSSTTAVFTRLSVDDSARLLAILREQIVTPKQS
ncbi:hypothetical protein [Micromonospora sp. NPDC092111]|uniref:hypothetical protein n=1 Tax=Micromonospora sp. NPDC092111 TaxID=3364289 RepID=UPI003807CE5D